MIKMKDSGIAWIGDIPSDWNIAPNKRVMQKSKIICDKYNNENVLSLTMNGVIVRDLENPTGKMPLTFDGYQYVQAGNLLMCLFDIDVTPRCVGVINNDGVTSPAYSQFKLLNDNYVRYYYYYYLYLDFTKELLHLAKNLRHSLTESQLGEIYVPVPPLKTQHRIVDYLDEKCAKIDSIIEKQQAVIEKLKEYKLSVITEVVTKGLNPNVEMKDSGVNWIGEIPAHWYVTRIKKCCILKTGTTPSTSNNEWFNGNVRWYTPGDFNENYVLKKSTRTLSQKAIDDGEAVIAEGETVMIIGIGGTAGKIGISEGVCSFNQQITALTNSTVYPKYLMYWMIANTKFLKETAMFTTLPILNNQTIGNYLCIIPRDNNEAQRIAEFLDKKCHQIEESIASKQMIIDKLTEYKKSLIYEVVTGKKEV